MARLGVVMTSVVWLSACASQYGATVDATSPDQLRLDQVATRVMRAASEFCDDGTRSAVRPGGAPAAQANARKTGRSERGTMGVRGGEAANLGRPATARLPGAATSSPERGVMPDPGAAPPAAGADAAEASCPYPVVLSDRDIVYASTNGRRIKMTHGMLAFASNDSELAFVLSHELAHDLLGHAAAFYDGSRQRMEFEADYVGIYITARAGYDVDVASRFILRLAGAFPSIRDDSSYPAPAARYAMLQRAVKEIALKTSSKSPLVPDFATRLPGSL